VHGARISFTIMNVEEEEEEEKEEEEEEEEEDLRHYV
jgi:hypothetical protein